MVPAGLRHPSLGYIRDVIDPADFVNNLILYMPLGIALGGRSILRAFFVGLGLSTCAEVLQLGYLDRIPSFLDIANNTVGTVIGYGIATLILRTGHDPRSVRLYRPIAIAAIPLGIVGALMLIHRSPPSDFSNWSPGFHLAAGNELTGDRPWSGTISELAIYPFAMPPSQISDLAGKSWPTAGAVVGPMQPTAFTTVGGRQILSSQEESSLYQTLMSHSQLTLLVRMQTNNLEQTGPARIITYSIDPIYRNFTLGQIGNTLTFRLRTPSAGLNGANPALYTGPVLSLNRPVLVAAVYDGRFSRLYLDGKQVSQVDLGARRPRLPRKLVRWLPGSLPLREIELGGAEILVSGLFTIGIFALCGVPNRKLLRFLLGGVAGGMIGAVVWAFGVSNPLLGLALLVECVGAGLVISASVDGETVGRVLGSRGRT
jgi:hypothetical protein